MHLTGICMHVCMHALPHDVTGRCMQLLHGLCCFYFISDIPLSPGTLQDSRGGTLTSKERSKGALSRHNITAIFTEKLRQCLQTFNGCLFHPEKKLSYILVCLNEETTIILVIGCLTVDLETKQNRKKKNFFRNFNLFRRKR